MDWPILIALLIVFLLLIFVFVSLVGKWREDEAAAYDRKSAADREYHTAIMRAAHVEVVGGRAYLFSGVDKKTHEVMWQDFPADSAGIQQAQVVEAKNDPRHALLSELVRLTLLLDGYGPRATKLATCDRAQAEHKARGGIFADRDKWNDAVKYGVELGLLMTSNQGTLIKEPHTAADLGYELLINSAVLKSAVDALPGTPPAG